VLISIVDQLRLVFVSSSFKNIIRTSRNKLLRDRVRPSLRLGIRPVRSRAPPA
jgi:hypothetical protein